MNAPLTTKDGWFLSNHLIQCPGCSQQIPTDIQPLCSRDTWKAICNTCQHEFRIRAVILSPPALQTKPEAFDTSTKDDEVSEEAACVISECEEILGKIDELPERAEDFGESVREKIESIKSWIEEHGRVTDKQKEAVANMGDAVDRWFQ
ncbi:MAG: hypothetical protein NT069_29300 [Planctomycetota bacterium]|nr:hypothetical protein [Planctomycetota bacterium]